MTKKSETKNIVEVKTALADKYERLARTRRSKPGKKHAAAPCRSDFAARLPTPQRAIRNEFPRRSRRIASGAQSCSGSNGHRFHGLGRSRVSSRRRRRCLKPPEHQSFWLWVMCLTGVDYFSTLGYQPSIAFEAVGLLAPLATVVLIAVTLGCALPVYSRVAEESPLGQARSRCWSGCSTAGRPSSSCWCCSASRPPISSSPNALRGRRGRASDSQSVLGRRARRSCRARWCVTMALLVLLGGDVPARLQRSDRHRRRDRRRLSGAERDRDRQRAGLPGCFIRSVVGNWYESVLIGQLAHRARRERLVAGDRRPA